jgi:hypothetical protein
MAPIEMDNGPAAQDQARRELHRSGRARSYQPMTLVVSESWDAGWKAYSQRQQVAGPLRPPTRC